MYVLLIAFYELGRQPFGLASPAAWLAREGADVDCLDLSVERFDDERVRRADLVALHLPMHTATRLAVRELPRIRELNPGAHLCCYGLYAPLNEDHLRRLGAQTILGGEFETALAALARALRRAGAGEASGPPPPSVSLEAQRFLTPDRGGLPALERYARLQIGDETRSVGYTEASRGCKHGCRHCPIVPVYGGRFRIVQPDVVLADVRNQVAVGARHITFGDPDFLNGPTHAVRVVESMRREFPELTYDVTIKVEHLLRHRGHLAALRDTGCLFVTSAVEAVDDRVLRLLDKGHTAADFRQSVRLMRRIGLGLNPTFVAFTPWQTRRGYLELLRELVELELVDCVAPIQLAIRLLVTARSPLLELDEVRARVGELDSGGLAHPWEHPDPEVDRLQQRAIAVVQEGQRRDESRRRIFERLLVLALEADGASGARLDVAGRLPPAPRVTVPYLTEPWYC